MRMMVLCFFLSSFLFVSPYKTCAGDNLPSPGKVPSFSADELNGSINEELSKKEYSWKMPREKPPMKERTGWFAAFMDEALDIMKTGFRKVGEWFSSFLEWVIKQLGRLFTFRDRGGGLDLGWTKSVNLLLFILLCIAVCFLGITVWRMLQKRKVQKTEQVIVSGRSIPDIAGDDLSAEKLPADKWLELAGDFMIQGNRRFALRALYLACLAHLSQQGMIALARSKSNRDYERELTRKAGDMPDLLLPFFMNRDIFDTIWYGMHEVTDSMVKDFRANQESIMRVAGNG